MTLRVTPAEIVAAAEASGAPGLLSVAPGWGRVRLGDVARVVNGAPFGSQHFNVTGAGMPLIRIRDVRTSAVSTWYGGPWEPTHLVEPGSLLVGMDGDFNAATWRGPVGLLNQRVCRIEVDADRYNRRFLEYALQGYLDAIWKATSSTTVKHLSSRSIADIPLPNPPLDEQRRIVEILEDHLSRLDAANDYLDAALAGVAPWRQASVDSAFLHQLPQLASAVRPTPDFHLERRATTRNDKTGAPCAPNTEGLTAPPWQVVSLEAASDADRAIRYGILKPRVDGGGTVPYVEVKDLAGYTLAGKELRRTSDQLDLQFHGARIRQGDVLIAVRGSYERAAVVPAGMDGTNISRDVARVAPLPSLDPTFLWHWLQTSIAKGYLRRHARGVAVKGVNISTLRALPVPAVPREAQLQLVTALENVASAPARIEAQIIAARRRSGALRSALLAAAFSGRLTGRSSDLDLAEEMAPT